MVCFRCLPVHCRHGSDWESEAKERGPISKATGPSQQSEPVGSGGRQPFPSTSCPDMLPDHFECLDYAWIYFFFKVSKATLLTF